MPITAAIRALAPMRTIAFAAGLAFIAPLCGPASAADDAHSHMHAGAADARQALDFPPPMRNHMLSNMRAHLESLGDILAALAANDAGKAADIADARLGLASPDAAACRKDAAGGMAAMMGEHMPEPMRALGMAMHQSASDFAEIARSAKTAGDQKPALAALGKVVQNCAACHSAYRLR